MIRALQIIQDSFTHSTTKRNPGSSFAGLDRQTDKILSTLSPREEMILRLRYGIGQGAGTLDELSRQFSVTRWRVRQIEVKALRKVRERSRSLYFKASHCLQHH